ncbi:aldose epimerase family protein [Litoreibacter albidus]|uniref:Aldose 1-epimerase n=1 Tax=Litoreibacter albidus TaxID=670155 RepID=A0A1H3ASJ9_9RHOB|nr:aldose epimerase family protein [Litoreibacter albidus]SDX32667.1 aldose 1-epimerase [Litoreibacter albidus]
MTELITTANFKAITISGSGMTARILPFGASLVDLRLEGWAHPLVIGLKDEASYLEERHLYLGAVIGRFANRIAHGRTIVDGQPVLLDCNAPPHHSHGGSNGFASKFWKVSKAQGASATLKLRSPDGEAGYPGRVDVIATYELVPPHTLRLTLEATTTRNTILNLCHHPYFNLDGRARIDNHCLQVDAERYLPCDETVLPTGQINHVAHSDFDFRQAVRIGDKIEGGTLYNNSYCLCDEPSRVLTYAARLSADRGPQLEVWTTQAGLHVYSGHKLKTESKGQNGREIAAFGGLCLEAQNWPNSANMPNFPSPSLAADETYRQVTEYRFQMTR